MFWEQRAKLYKVSWIQIRKQLWKVQYKISAILFPIVGNYIVLFDNSFFGQPRIETYLVYFSLLIMSLVIIALPFLCPFIFLEYDSKEELTEKYSKSDYHIEILKALEIKVLPEGAKPNTDWQNRLSESWDKAENTNNGKHVIITAYLFASALGIIASISSIFRVLQTMFN